MKAGRKGKPIVKVDKITREIIAEYPSIGAAARGEYLEYSSIESQCNGRITVGIQEFYFRFAEDFDPDEVFNCSSFRGLPMMLVDMEKNEVRITTNREGIAEWLGVSPSTVNCAISNKRLILHRYAIYPLRGNPTKAVEAILEKMRPKYVEEGRS